MSSLLAAFARRGDRPIERRPFEAWSIVIPAGFPETFVEEQGYWHAWTSDRAVSLTSIAITDKRGQHLSVDEISREIDAAGLLPDGAPVDALPPGCLGRAVIADATQPACASTLLSGFLVAESRVLIVTITTDDLAWARETWLSIRAHSTSTPRLSRAERRRHRPRR